MSAPHHRLEVEPLRGVGEIQSGADLAAEISRAAGEQTTLLGSGDVIVIAQKVISKAEGRVMSLAEVQPAERAQQLGDQLGRDPRLVQVILDESVELLRAERGVLITRTRHGFVCANAGVDQSNLPEADSVCLLPLDPDRSARELRARLTELTGHHPAVVISDSFGRAWRIGQAEVAIGCAGLEPLDDLRGEADAYGRELTATIAVTADEAASAAGLVRGKDSGDAVVIVRGLERYVKEADGPGAAAIIRPIDEDLFP